MASSSGLHSLLKIPCATRAREAMQEHQDLCTQSFRNLHWALPGKLGSTGSMRIQIPMAIDANGRRSLADRLARAALAGQPRSTDAEHSARCISGVLARALPKLERRQIAGDLNRAALAAESIYTASAAPALSEGAALHGVVPDVEDPVAQL
eukprot:11170102-Lingulodinium_polyedra.AAC.1